MNNAIEIDLCDYNEPDDLKAVAMLLNAYIEDEMGGGEKLNPIKQLRLVDGLNNHPTSIVLLAKLNGLYAGMIVAFENFSTFSVAPMINIHDVIVLKDFRGQGVGKALMQKISDLAAEKKCSRITLEVRHDNEIAQKLYKNMDFADTEPPMFFWRKYLKS